MPKAAEYVHFNNGTRKVYALVIGSDPADGNTLDLWSEEGSIHRGVPRREPADYGPEGGGDTWSEAG